MTSSKRLRIYLAGPEVFVPEAKALGERKARLCADAGFEGLFPLDAAVDLTGLTSAEQAQRIYRADVAMMRSCDLVIANLTPFRGVSMDSGTAFEAGFMAALGRPVLGYTNCAEDYRARAARYRRSPPPLIDADRADAQVEDFGLTENLMIEIAIRDSGFEVERHAAQQGEEMMDLTAFARCLGQARKRVL